MRRTRLMVIVILICALMPAAYARAEGVSLSIAPLVEGVPVSISCASALLVEPESGQIIFELNADEKRPVASIIKVMTILIALEAINEGRVALDDTVAITKNASGMGGSQVLLDTGEAQPLSVLLKSVIVGSANDAAVAIAEHLYGSEALFVDVMNKRAGELGMTDTRFKNSTGLPVSGQYTTARDVARMSGALYALPGYYEFSTIWMDEVDHHDGRVTQLTNTNRLIRLYDGCDGGKTGSTNEAGYCISATARRGDMRLIAVVLGSGTGAARFSAAQAMFDYGFANYRLYPVAEKGTRVRGTLPVSGGDVDGIQLMLNGDLRLLMSKADNPDIQLVPMLPRYVNAPVARGDTVGSVDVVLNGRVIARIPVAAAQSANRQYFKSAWRRVWRRWLF